MMRIPYKLPSRLPSRTNGVTILVFGVVLLVLGICAIGYWRYVEAQTLHLQERNFRSLTVISKSLAGMVVNYENVFKSVIEGHPPNSNDNEARQRAYEKALRALPALQHVTVIEQASERNGLNVEFVRKNSASFMKLTHVHEDRTGRKTRWRTEAEIDIGMLMRQLVTEDIFSDVLLADPMGKVLYHHQCTRNSSGFEFENVASLLNSLNDSESKDGGAEKGGVRRKGDLVSTLPLFNETPIGGISHMIFAQATGLFADRGTAQALILVGIVPAGPFHAEARAIPLNYLLLMVGLMLVIFFLLPYVKLRTNLPVERLTSISVTVLIISTILGTALLTFALASVTTYQNMEQHLNAQLEQVAKDIRDRFSHDVEQGLRQLEEFDGSCNSKGSKCKKELEKETKESKNHNHWAQHLCLRMNERKLIFFPNAPDLIFYPDGSDRCATGVVYPKINTMLWERSIGERELRALWSREPGPWKSVKLDERITEVVYPNVSTMLWVGSSGELKALWSHESAPWKYVNLEERQYVGRIWEGETFTRDKQKFWIQPIYSWTTGSNSAVISIKSRASPSSSKANSDRPIVAALEVKVPSLTDVGVPPGMGFAVIDQNGLVLFHSDPRRNLRENLLEETDREGRFRRAVFARTTDRFDGLYWGKDRHFQITPLSRPPEINEPPDTHWSLVTYWDTDMLRFLNLRALYSSGALFLIYMVSALIIGMMGRWVYSHLNEGVYRWVWPQTEHLHRYVMALSLLIVSLGAVGVWYIRPHSDPVMLLWAVLPALVAAAVFLSLTHTKADHTDKNKTDESARQTYRWSHALVVTTLLLTVVVMPALVFFRVAVDVEWRLLAKFSQFDLVRDREILEMSVRKFNRDSSYDETASNTVRTQFLQNLLNEQNAYVNFPFTSNWLEGGVSDSPSKKAVQRWDERLIRLLYRIMGRPNVGQSGVEPDIFLEAPGRWQEQESGTLELVDKALGTNTRTILRSEIPSPIPQWLYSLLVFSGLVPLLVYWIKNTYVLVVAVCVVVGFHVCGFVDQAVGVLAASVVLYGACYILPKFAARRILLLDFPHPLMGPGAPEEGQGVVNRVADDKAPPSWPSGLSDVFVNEFSGLRNALRLTGIPWSDNLSNYRQDILKQDIKEEFDVAKEQIIRGLLVAATEQYMKIWKKCTESQRRSLFNLARDGFLNSRNPDIGPLLEKGLIVADLNLRLMNESFQRFMIRTGLKECLDEHIVQEKASTWFQVWRPIGAGLVPIIVLLVSTQEQYREISLAFLGALPALLGAFSQALISSKKEKPETAPSA